MVNRWYVVQSKPQHEMEVIENLRNQRFVCYLPQYVKTKIKRGKKIQVIEALFPSYLFVRFDISKDRWRSINGTRGVSKLLSSTDEYVSPLPTGFVEKMIEKADSNGYLTELTTEKIITKFIIGDKVTIKDGLFEGVTGTCCKIKENSATILLTLLSGQMELSLPISSIEHTKVQV